MPDDLIQLSADPLDVAGAIAFVTDGRAGAVDVFLGTTRHDTSPTGKPLIALDYEAYAEMAVGQMAELAKRARERWPVLKLAILHRTGNVAVGEPSVLIAISTPHRADAFAACRFLIDTLKAEVTVWKKEVWADGPATWVHPRKTNEDRG
jgi:molybdopterin synthase catalytic subunit